MSLKQAQLETGVRHPFPPVVDDHSLVLVLGSFPSVKSRENAFYYGHPQNRFWRVLAQLFSEETPMTVVTKTAFLRKHRIALWDVVAACDITGSADSALIPHAYQDIATLLTKTQIKYVFANGQTAGKLYKAHIEPITGIPAHILPSTSAANAAWTLEKLVFAWQTLAAALQKHEKDKRMECNPL